MLQIGNIYAVKNEIVESLVDLLRQRFPQHEEDVALLRPFVYVYGKPYLKQ